MGLPMPCLRFLAREHRRQPFVGPVLVLGRQAVNATSQQVLSMLRVEGIEPTPLPDEMSLHTGIPSLLRANNAEYISDKAFFWTLGGLPLFALDISDYEGADYIADLNSPVSDELAERFGLIIDGGMFEHVFDLKQAFINVNRMLKPGGRVIHMNPATNFLEHGFYQFSPCLFYDYYGINGFDGLQCFIAQQPAKNVNKGKWEFWQWDAKRTRSHLSSNRILAIFFCAEKTEQSTIHKVPQQGQFFGQYPWGLDVKQPIQINKSGTVNRMITKVKDHTPPGIKSILRTLLKKDASRRPWRLKYLGKF